MVGEAHFMKVIWDKVFKNGPSKICGRQSLKNLKGYAVCSNRQYPFKCFKDCLPQILLDPFLNALSHLLLQVRIIKTILKLVQ